MLFDVLIKVFEMLLPLIGFAGAVLLFWGLLEYFTTKGDDLSKKEGKISALKGVGTIGIALVLWLLIVFLKNFVV